MELLTWGEGILVFKFQMQTPMTEFEIESLRKRMRSHKPSGHAPAQASSADPSDGDGPSSPGAL